MRYKFRAWHKTAREMLYEDYYGDVFKWLKEGQPIEIMQWTGLRDMNEKEIYEADRIKFSGTKYDTATATVEFRDGKFVLALDDSEYGYRDISGWKNVTVIGNIHEKEKPL